MPILDRFWWLRLARTLPVLLLLCLCVLLVWSMVTQPSTIEGGPLAFCVVGLLFLIGVLWVLVGDTVRARRRKRLRLALLRGEAVDLRPTPRATTLGTIALPASGAHLPLRLLWHEPWPWRVIRGICGMVPVIALYGILVDITGTRVVPIPMPTGLPPLQVTPAVAVAVACLVAVIVVLVDGRPYGVIADDEGVREVRRVGRTRLVRWSEARLLEVREPNWGQSDLSYVYALYSTRTYAAWHWPKAQTEAPLAATRDESNARSRALLAVIEERTGLVPRMLEVR